MVKSCGWCVVFSVPDSSYSHPPILRKISSWSVISCPRLSPIFYLIHWSIHLPPPFQHPSWLVYFLSYIRTVLSFSLLLSLYFHWMWKVLTIETREGWPLLTVETAWDEWGLEEYKWKGLTWLVCWAHCAGTGDFSLTVHCLIFFVPSPASWAGTLAGSPIS